MTEVFDWLEPHGSTVLMFENYQRGWDRLFPYNAGSTRTIDPVWTDPGNNFHARRSELVKLGWIKSCP